jgi:DNA helicase-2/ATP-dependent DNA helicase PcrA
MKITDKSPDKASLQESQFLSEIKLTSPDLQINKVSYQTDEPSSVNEMVQYLAELLTPAPLPDEITLEKEYIAETLSKYKLNVTHLNKYLKCKLSFYYENILKIPSARSASMGFGNAVHYALEQLFRTMLADENREFPTIDTFIGYFKKGMQNYASHFTTTEYKLKIDFAEQLLPDYYHTYINAWEKVARVEYRFSNILYDDIPLTGAIDKIEFLNAKECNVVDYKTGDPDRAKKKMFPPTKPEADLSQAKFEEVYGGDYWRQIVFYKILMDLDKTNEWKMLSGEIDCIQKNKSNTFNKFKLNLTIEDELLVKKQIKDTYKGIISQDFKGCGDKDCQWCTFAREQNVYTFNSVED